MLHPAKTVRTSRFRAAPTDLLARALRKGSTKHGSSRHTVDNRAMAAALSVPIAGQSAGEHAAAGNEYDQRRRHLSTRSCHSTQRDFAPITEIATIRNVRHPSLRRNR
jgi:hypothetical protein